MTFDDFASHARGSSESRSATGARNVRVFGSVARGAAVPGSDVKFLVDFDPDRTVLDLSALILELQAALGCEDDLRWLTRDGRAAEPIRREAIAL